MEKVMQQKNYVYGRLTMKRILKLENQKSVINLAIYEDGGRR